jgi:hypothetical protein
MDIITKKGEKMPKRTLCRSLFVYVLIFFSFFCTFSLFSEQATLPEEEKENSEALFLRRIVEFWESGQYSIVKGEIEKYLAEHQKSSFSNELFVFLGDIFLKEEKYEDALTSYKKITDNSIKQTVFLNFLLCLYELKRYDLVASECHFYLQQYLSVDPEISRQVKIYLASAYYENAISASGDTAKSYALMAKPYFEDLLKTNFSNEIWPILTTLHHILKDHKAASDLYFSFADQYPEKKEEFLFQAANSALEFDKELALQTFATICRTGKSYVRDAADGRMRLLYELKKYSDLILLSDSLMEVCSKENLPFFHFLLGKSYFEMKDYKHASIEMKKSLDCEGNNGAPKRDVLALIMSAAHQMQDRDLFEEGFNRFEKSFPQDEELPKALLAKALLNKKSSRFVEAEKDFERLETHASLLEDQEIFFYEYADLLFQMKRSLKSKECFSKLLEVSKEGARKQEAFRGFVNASISVAFDEKEKEKALLLKQELIQSLQKILSEKEILNDNEREEYTYFLGQCQFECGNFAQALDVLGPWADKENHSPHLAQAHLFLAQCFDELKKDKKNFCSHVEKALALKDPSLKESSMHLLLFNGYFQMAQEDREMIHQAAEHLYLASKDDAIQIQKENGLWLAQYYYHRAEKFANEGQWKGKKEEILRMQEERRRASSIINKNLNFPLQGTISPQEEENLFRLANLYHWDQKEKESFELLELLNEQYQKAPSMAWAFRDSALLMLAFDYAEKNEKEKAFVFLDEIISSKRALDAVVKATFEKSRLRISLLSEEEKNLSSPQVVGILNELKQIRLQRKLESEPLHFEAALLGIDLQVALEKELPLDQKRLTLLQNFKEEFFSQEDVLSKDYHEERNKLKDKELLLQSYLKLIDLEILLCKGKMEKEKNPKEAAQYYLEAEQLIHSLHEGSSILTAELYSRICKDNQALEKESKDLSLMEKR